jgi:hypothetical protein
MIDDKTLSVHLLVISVFAMYTALVLCFRSRTAPTETTIKTNTAST